MSTAAEQILPHCLKPEEIASGDAKIREARAKELVLWFARFYEGHANPKWLAAHAAELAHYVATIKGL